MINSTDGDWPEKCLLLLNVVILMRGYSLAAGQDRHCFQGESQIAGS